MMLNCTYGKVCYAADHDLIQFDLNAVAKWSLHNELPYLSVPKRLHVYAL